MIDTYTELNVIDYIELHCYRLY